MSIHVRGKKISQAKYTETCKFAVLMLRDHLYEMHSWQIFDTERVWRTVIVREAKREAKSSLLEDNTKTGGEE